MDPAWIGVFGALVGAGGAALTGLVGAIVTWRIARAKVEADERARREQWQLEYNERVRTEWANWFRAVARLRNSIQFAPLETPGQTAAAVEKLKEMGESGELHAFPLLLVERHPDAQKQVGALMNLIAMFAVQFGSLGTVEQYAAIAQLNEEIAKTLLWVRENCFALPVPPDVKELGSKGE